MLLLKTMLELQKIFLCNGKFGLQEQAALFGTVSFVRGLPRSVLSLLMKTLFCKYWRIDTWLSCGLQTLMKISTS